jgi:hypothetical protein
MKNPPVKDYVNNAQLSAASGFLSQNSRIFDVLFSTTINPQPAKR